jgi:hypothetical protein
MYVKPTLRSEKMALMLNVLWPLGHFLVSSTKVGSTYTNGVPQTGQTFKADRTLEMLTSSDIQYPSPRYRLDEAPI